jgi:imidazolonepropionase-like amidohydrolase
LVVLLPAFEATNGQGTANTDFIVTNVRVFDGTSVSASIDVRVSRGLIEAVGADLVRSQSVRTIDGAGATLLPGFIDAHVHVRDAVDLRQALVFGVTTVLDMGAVIGVESMLALRDVAATTTEMADLRSAGFPAGAPRGDAPDGRISVEWPSVATVEEARLFVTDHAVGSDYLKVGLTGVRSATTGRPSLDESQTRALVEGAHSNRLLTVAHIETLEDVNIALNARIDGLAHVWRRGGSNPEIARRVAEHGVFVIPTLAIPDGFMLEGRTSLLADKRFRAVLSSRIEEHLTQPFSSRTPGLDPRGNLERQMAATRDLHEAGAVLLVGTDANRDNPAAFGISLHRELELLTEAGLNPVEVLIAATANAADAFRLEDRGRIVPGRRADMVLVGGDPTSDILATRDILRVWKGGIEVDRIAVGPETRVSN